MPNDNSSSAPGQNKEFTIVVNAREKTVTEKKLSYWDVIKLAYPNAQPQPNVVYRVDYTNPHGRDGSLVEGQEVPIKEGVIFNVSPTDKS